MDIDREKRQGNSLTLIPEDYVLGVSRKCACNAICFMLANIDTHIEVTGRKQQIALRVSNFHRAGC